MKKTGNQPNRSAIKVGYPGVKIILLQVLPGYESNVEKEFREHLVAMKEKGCIQDFWTYKLFGDWDIAIVYECAEFKQDTLYAGTIKRIINSTEFFSFPWDVSKDENFHSTFKKDLMDKPAVGITFFKVHPDALSLGSSPLSVADIDQAFVEVISDTRFSCLCSLGWAEFILLTHGSSVETLVDNINSTLANVVVKQGPESGNGINLAEKTFSMVGINYRCLEDKKTLYKYFKNAKFRDDIKINVGVTCDLPAMEEVRKTVLNTFFGEAGSSGDNICSVIGNRDISFEIDKNVINNWADFIYYLLKFRVEQRDDLYSTSVDIRSSHFSIHRYKSASSSRLPIIDLSKQQAEGMRERIGHLADMVISSIYYFNELMQNRINADSYHDMWRYMVQLLKVALQVNVEDLNLPDDIPKRFDVIKYGGAQRSAGVFFNQEYQRGIPVLPKGGVQGIIQAAESIPQFVYKTIYGVDWRGFIISGYSIGYSHQQGGVINIHSEAVFNPEKWWGLFHEIGHTWVYSKQVNQQTCIFEDKHFQNAIKFNMNIIKEGDGNYNEAIKEIGELLADVFHYYFFTGRDFEQYFIIVWRYLLTEMKSDPAMKGAWSFYLFRAFYVFVYDMLYVKKELNYDALDFSKIGSLFRVFVKQFKEMIKIPVGAAEEPVITAYLARFKWSLEYCKKAIEETRVNFFDESEATNINKNLIPKLRNGSLIKSSELKNPALLILLLKRFTLSEEFVQSGPEEKFKMRMATILSLWYYYQAIKPSVPSGDEN
ncbi:MAG: hypothetical protein NT178_16510 [Proteobacteria bacterium]|nr:hypothetical protein [Pseudomonadota bacterium]